ncbi:MAG: BadF/BadG/BcrA/BcrD ATPase family protein [Bacillota bacterium]
MGLILAIDAGGTKTDCIVGTVHGKILGRSQAGPANYQVSGKDGMKASLLEAIGKAKGLLPVDGEPFDLVWVGAAGVNRPADREAVLGLIQSLNLARKAVVDNDAVIALAGGTLAHPGVVVIAGTGSIAFGVNAKGERSRSGGWGYILGDEGSAYAIGREALTSVVRASDGRGDPTSLREAVLQHFKIGSPEDLIEIAYRRGLDRTDIAGLSVLVADAARKGDRVARRILRRAGTELGLAAAAVVKSLGMQDQALCCITSGGVFSSGEIVRRALVRELTKVAPLFQVLQARFPPVVGALLLAIQELGHTITGRVVANIEESLFQ